MDKDISTVYAIISSVFGFLFGVEVGVVLCAIGGAFLSLRFCPTKGTFARLSHVFYSSAITCVVIGELYKPNDFGKIAGFIPDLMPPKIAAILMSFLLLLLAEKAYNAISGTDITGKFNVLIDKWLDLWKPPPSQ